MPNLAFHIKVLDQVIAKLGSDPLAGVLSSNKQFAVLGAMGPDLLRYRPVGQNLASALLGLVNSNGTLTSLNLDELQELMVKPLGGAYSVLFSALVLPVWPVLSRITAFLDKMDAIAAPNNQDEIALAQAIPEALAIQSDIGTLQALRTKLPSLTQVVGQIVILRPRIQLDPTSPQDPLPGGILQKLPNPMPTWSPGGDRLHEFLRWHRPGSFAKELQRRANLSNDPKLQAFAGGWLCHFASSVTAEPAVNNITGGPYRTHWWRNRLVGNFIDSWTYGYYQSSTRPTMAGHDPSPPYDQWPSICSANLQNEFNIAGLAGSPLNDVPDAVKAMANGTVGTLPELSAQDLTNIAKLLNDTVNAVYSTPTPIPLPGDSFPPLVTAAPPGFSVNNIKEAFAGAYAVYWFMTSGSGALGDNAIGPPPSTAPTPPSWISSSSPPTAEQAGLDTAAAVCALILAIILLFALVTGALLLGIIALVALMNTSVVDWDKVRDNLYWMRKMLVDAQNGIRDALVWAGLAYPPSLLLGMIDANGHTLPVTDLSPPNPAGPPQGNVPATLGLPLCHTSLSESSLMAYPAQMDLRVTTQIGAVTAAIPDANFAISPILPPTPAGTSPTDREQDNRSTISANINQPIPNNMYPDYFVENALDATSPAKGILTTPRQFPSPALKSGIYVSFGSAVYNATLLMQNSAAIATSATFKLPEYNLDGDHGYGWLAWKDSQSFVPSLARPTPIYLNKIIVDQEL